MPLTIATWNINSVRLRIDLVTRFLTEAGPDILCLQETKSPVDKIPVDKLVAAGYPHIAARGQKGYNGVAIISRVPIEDAGHIDWCEKGDARHVAARIGGATIHNFYVPAGGDEPDREKNVKFAHKLDFVAEMTAWGKKDRTPGVLVGDLNIAPLEEDVWSHKQLLKVVSHTPVEVDALNGALSAGGWSDVVRQDIPAPEKLYSWWSYRSKDWEGADKGRRLDHVWSRGVSHVAGSSRVLKQWRGEEKPSDHAPVLVDFDL